MSYLEEHRNEIFKKYNDDELLRDVENYKTKSGRLLKLINHFFEECMFNCRNTRMRLTPMEALQDEWSVSELFRLIGRNKKLYAGTDVQNLKKCLSLGYVGARRVANFCPKNARMIYRRYFDNLDGLNILDTSCGFGSRMLAALLNGANYYGFDPNKELFGKLKECESWLRVHNEVSDSQVCDVHCLGSEVHVPELDGKMDLSFTSPPYFNLEVYSDDGFSSSKNLGDYEAWVKEFVVPTVVNTYRYLKVGGYAMINIKNMRSKGNKPLYDDFMLAFQGVPGFEYVETFSMSHQHKRTFHHELDYQGFEEPVMVYRKVSQMEPDLESTWDYLVKSRKEPFVKPRMTKKAKSTITVVEAPKPPENQPLRVVSVWSKSTPPPPTIEVLEKPVAVLPSFELIVDSMDEIDPRTLGKLMVGLKSKVDLTMVHGEIGVDDIVARLCKGLGVNLRSLRGFDNEILPQYIGKRKLVGCQAGQKPVFALLDEERQE